MADPRLTHYLLKLATDSDELSRFNAADEEGRHALMRAAGLTDKQRDALASADSARITEEVTAEVSSGPGPAGGPHYTIQVGLNLQPCKKRK